MCSKVICRQCGKPTWSGCGEHIEIALAGVPKSDRCQGHDASSAPKSPGLLNRLFGR
ncbi:MAG: hypothetical protein ACKN9O_04555 [Actinomycetota bacterium]